MREDEARARLAEMLALYPVATVLHFLGDLLADEAAEFGVDPVRHEQLKTAEAALVVLGLGFEAALPWRG